MASKLDVGQSNNSLEKTKKNSISSFEIVKVVITDSKIFFCIAASVADVAAVNPNGIKTLLTNSLNTFFIIDKQVLRGSPKRLPIDPPDCAI